MSNISNDRLRNIVSCVRVMGKEKARENFDLSNETLNRYLRKARAEGVLDEVSEDVFERKPKVLVYDIETAPTKASVFKLWKENVPIDFVKSPWFLLSWSGKWLFDDKIESDVLTSEEALAENDKRIVTSLYKMMDEAEIVIGHNIIRYDTRRMNTRCLVHGLDPISPFQQVDTLMIAKKQFAFESNKLDYIARVLGVEGKMKHEGAMLWTRCVEGDPEALRIMEEYNRQDINVTEEVYVKLRPYAKSHPNMALYYDDMHTRCPNCGSMDLQYDTNRFYYTPANKYSSVRCNSCGASGRARTTALDKQKRQSLLASQAR